MFYVPVVLGGWCGTRFKSYEFIGTLLGTQQVRKKAVAFGDLSSCWISMGSNQLVHSDLWFLASARHYTCWILFSFLRLSLANPRDVYNVMTIKVDLQSVEHLDAPVWHQQPCKPSSKSLQSLSLTFLVVTWTSEGCQGTSQKMSHPTNIYITIRSQQHCNGLLCGVSARLQSGWNRDRCIELIDWSHMWIMCVNI